MGNDTNTPLIDLVTSNFNTYVQCIISGFFSLITMGYVMTFFKIEVMRILNQRLLMEEEYKLIL